MNRTLKSIAPAVIFGTLLLSTGHLTMAQQPAPDNTKANKGDRSASAVTADQAKEIASDRDTMQKIRKAVVADKSLSTYAHNVKIISQNGKVTLKGPVHTAEERATIEAKATEIAGAGNVTNEITVKGDKPAQK
jgi:osmotically-inducible protein OsmY